MRKLIPFAILGFFVLMGITTAVTIPTVFTIVNNPIKCTTYLWIFTTGCTLQSKTAIVVGNFTGNITVSPVDFTNVAFQNQTNNFNQFNQFTSMNISGVLFVGNNRSAFPVNCTANQFLSSLGSNGIFICSNDVDPATDFTNVAFVNRSQNWTEINNFTNNTYFFNVNISNRLFVGNNQSAFPIDPTNGLALIALDNSGIFTKGSFITSLANVSFLNNSQNYTGINNFTANSYFTNLNVSGQLFVGNNRSAFPTTCNGNFFLSSFGSNGIFICTSPDYTNIAFVNQTNNFTGNNYFNNLNVSNQLFVGNNRSAFPITCPIDQQLTSLGSDGQFICTPSNRTGVMSLVADNETQINGTSTINETVNIPANTFSKLIIRSDWQMITLANTAINGVFELNRAGTVIQSINITIPAGGGGNIFRIEGSLGGSSTITSGVFNAKFYPSSMGGFGGSTAKIINLIVYGVS